MYEIFSEHPKCAIEIDRLLCQLVVKRQGYLLNSARACASTAAKSVSVDAVDFGELFSDIFDPELD